MSRSPPPSCSTRMASPNRRAIRWCARYAIPLILPNGSGRAILFYESALEADGAVEGVNEKHAARIFDVGPSLVRAQALADPVAVARAIVSEKVRASAESVPAIDERPWRSRIDEARCVAEIVTIEARIAAAYWRAFRDLGLPSARAADLRAHGSGSPTGKRALNFSARNTPRIRSMPCSTRPMVEAGRLARALTAGVSMPIGFLHSYKHRRNSLVWDAIEPLRPLIDARAFNFIVQENLSGRLSASGSERTSDRSRDHRRASAGFAVAVGNGTRTRRDGWRGRLQGPSNNI